MGSYEAAVATLNSMQTVATASLTTGSTKEDKKAKVSRVVNFLQRVGLSVDDIDNLSVIHVAGTKGKGSTCAYAESILRHHGFKTGFYSSPHLVEARERIRINGRPITKEVFTSCFWDVYTKLLNTKDENEGTMPLYFSFMTVMAFTLFMKEKVDVVLLEVGMGGEYDYTNFVRTPVACGISSLGLDHTAQLGHTLEEITWHKAGIFKKGAPAVTVPQEESAMQVILQRAQDIQCPLYVAEPLTQEDLRIHNLTLGISGDQQVYNAALALHLCRLWFRKREGREDKASQLCVNTVAAIPRLHTGELTQKVVTGLSQCYWPGRAQTLRKTGVTYYLDGAHTTESMQQCVRWFMQAANEEAKQITGRVSRSLVFNMTGDRSASTMLQYLTLCGFHRAAFCPNIPSSAKIIPDQVNFKVSKTAMLENCVSYRKVWEDLLSTLIAKDVKHSLCDSTKIIHTCPACPPDFSHHTCTCTCTCTCLHHKQSSPVQVSGGPRCVSATFPCISTALKWTSHDREPSCCDVSVQNEAEVANNVDHVQVLVTGSLILVGDVLGIIYPTLND
ncbi:folylpolyglutamate synthase, mitochondrial-like [Pomacea canaliculata]|uniref:folylpolyglutamate synthase, mitochondrial-like n=1 Tax=Pomacea canaliculata TaxID=400727 RepID=UPI000D73548E|nr:folylpolyglutamate synthase, mitochondrial-like [Pomacea canaliculata]